VSYEYLDFRGEVWARDVNLGVISLKTILEVMRAKRM
jgi:hypothetical protein